MPFTLLDYLGNYYVLRFIDDIIKYKKYFNETIQFDKNHVLAKITDFDEDAYARNDRLIFRDSKNEIMQLLNFASIEKEDIISWFNKKGIEGEGINKFFEKEEDKFIVETLIELANKYEIVFKLDTNKAIDYINNIFSFINQPFADYLHRVKSEDEFFNFIFVQLHKLGMEQEEPYKFLSCMIKSLSTEEIDKIRPTFTEILKKKIENDEICIEMYFETIHPHEKLRVELDNSFFEVRVRSFFEAEVNSFSEKAKVNLNRNRLYMIIFLFQNLKNEKFSSKFVLFCLDSCLKSPDICDKEVFFKFLIEQIKSNRSSYEDKDIKNIISDNKEMDFTYFNTLIELLPKLNLCEFNDKLKIFFNEFQEENDEFIERYFLDFVSPIIKNKLEIGEYIWIFQDLLDVSIDFIYKSPKIFYETHYLLKQKGIELILDKYDCKIKECIQSLENVFNKTQKTEDIDELKLQSYYKLLKNAFEKNMISLDYDFTQLYKVLLQINEIFEVYDGIVLLHYLNKHIENNKLKLNLDDFPSIFDSLEKKLDVNFVWSSSRLYIAHFIDYLSITQETTVLERIKKLMFQAVRKVCLGYSEIVCAGLKYLEKLDENIDFSDLITIESFPELLEINWEIVVYSLKDAIKKKTIIKLEDPSTLVEKGIFWSVDEFIIVLDYILAFYKDIMENSENLKKIVFHINSSCTNEILQRSLYDGNVNRKISEILDKATEIITNTNMSAMDKDFISQKKDSIIAFLETIRDQVIENSESAFMPGEKTVLAINDLLSELSVIIMENNIQVYASNSPDFKINLEKILVTNDNEDLMLPYVLIDFAETSLANTENQQVFSYAFYLYNEYKDNHGIQNNIKTILERYLFSIMIANHSIIHFSKNDTSIETSLFEIVKTLEKKYMKCTNPYRNYGSCEPGQKHRVAFVFDCLQTIEKYNDIKIAVSETLALKKLLQEWVLHNFSDIKFIIEHNDVILSNVDTEIEEYLKKNFIDKFKLPFDEEKKYMDYYNKSCDAYRKAVLHEYK